MRRYWLDKSCFNNEANNQHVKISGESFHHIFDVCRMQVGDKFEVLGFNDDAWLVEVTQIDKKSATAKKIDQRPLPQIGYPHIVLCLSVSRYQVMDAIVEKAVEMGVAEIKLFVSQQSFIKNVNNLPAGKLDRWKKIIVSATQQSGRGKLMPMAPPVDLDQILSQFNNRKAIASGLFAYEGEGNLTLREYAKNISSDHKEIWVFVGSEGGFSHKEVQRFQDLGLAPLSLGDQVLRVETACITLIAVLKYLCGLFDAPKS